MAIGEDYPHRNMIFEHPNHSFNDSDYLSDDLDHMHYRFYGMVIQLRAGMINEILVFQCKLKRWQSVKTVLTVVKCLATSVTVSMNLVVRQMILTTFNRLFTLIVGVATSWRMVP